MDKGDSMQDQIDNVSREKEILTKKNAKIKNAVTEMKNAVTGLIRTLDTA